MLGCPSPPSSHLENEENEMMKLKGKGRRNLEALWELELEKLENGRENFSSNFAVDYLYSRQVKASQHCSPI